MEVGEIEERILSFWKKDKTFEKSLKKTKNKKPYIFYDGPPFATGFPHYGHILGSVTKDVYGRFWTMKDRYVRRTWGWDCHGLPIENIAEKGLGINSKDEIEKIGVKKFNDYCRSRVMEYSSAWEKVVERIARWVDMKKPYRTMDNDYIESVWWAFKQLWDKGFIYQGERVLMYCPRCSTPLAKAEIAMDNSYKTIKENSVIVKFKLKDEDAYALAWTTTPWTLPSNLALTVNPNLDYIYVKDKKVKETYLIARKILDTLYKNKSEYEIVKQIKGSKLENKKYEPMFPYFSGAAGAFKILLGEFVAAEEGTGIVHTAPAFGEEDYNVCKKYGIPLVEPVDEKGKFTEKVTDFSGRLVHDCNEDIIEHLKKQGKVVLIKKITHEYPFCYRCDTKLIYKAIPAWFVNIQKVKPRLLSLSKKINWYPEFLREGRVKYTIETAPDWNISRNRYWASAMPVWVSADGEKMVIGSVAELKKYAVNLKGKIDLHKDFLDKVVLKKNGKEFRRVPEVLDCWFESGSMTFAQFHYPFENKAFFEKNFPAQFTAEYIAQVRTWFYYMIVLAAILFDDIPIENIVTTGTILAEDGQKMSKSRGNFTDPMELIKKYGVDALRFYLLSSPVMNAEDVNFSDKNVEEVYKKVILILYNTLMFYEISGKSKAPRGKVPNSKNILDKWIILRLQKFTMAMEKHLLEYDTIKACNEIRLFADELSTWYVRTSRERIEEEKSSRETLGYVLNEFSKVVAPILPFVSEYIYQSVNGKNKSVHLESYPVFKKKSGGDKLTGNMEAIRTIVSLGLRTRDRIQIGLKWPLAHAIVIGGEFKLSKEEEEIIKNQLNVKNILYTKGHVNTGITVDLDTTMTPELEAEGYARELARQVQAFRKQLGLQKKDRIELKVSTEKAFRKVLESQKDFLKERTNSSKIFFHSDDNQKNRPSVANLKETFKNKIDFTIKDKRGSIAIIVTNR